MTTHNWNRGAGDYLDPTKWSLTETPQPGETLNILAGADVRIGPFAVVRTENIQLDGQGEGQGPDFQVHAYDPATLRLGPFSAIWSDTTITTKSAALFSEVAAVIDTYGLNFNFGTIVAENDETGLNAAECHIHVDPASSRPGNGMLVNLGKLSSVGDGSLAIEGGSPGATLVNDGVIDVGGYVSLSTTAIGSGRMVLEKPYPYKATFVGSTLEINATVGCGQTVDFSPGGDRLVLDEPGGFDGLIKGFVTYSPNIDNDPALAGHINLQGVDFTSFSYEGTSQGGALIVTNAAGPPVTLRFAGDYQPKAGSFNLAHTGQGSEIAFRPAAQ